MSPIEFHFDYEEVTLAYPRFPHRITVWFDEDKFSGRHYEAIKALEGLRDRIRDWLQEHIREQGSDYVINLDRHGAVDWYYFETKAHAMLFKVAMS